MFAEGYTLTNVPLGWILLGVLFLVLVFMVGIRSVVNGNSSERKIAELEQRLDALGNRLAQLETWAHQVAAHLSQKNSRHHNTTMHDKD